MNDTKENGISRINMFHRVILLIIICSIIVLCVSLYFIEDIKNILIGLGTGMFTSALVTFFVDITNREVENNQKKKYKIMLLTPLCKSIENLYKPLITNINEYKFYDENKSGNYILLPLNDMRISRTFFDNLAKIRIDECDAEKKSQIFKLIDIRPIWYEALVYQYKALPLEMFLLNDIITQTEYDKLKNYSPIEACEKSIYKLENSGISEQEKFEAAVQLMRISFNIMNKIIFMFEFINQTIIDRNMHIKNNLDATWHFTYYVYSDEYIANEIERSSHGEAYISEQIENLEGNNITDLHNRLLLAIFMEDTEEIKNILSEVDKNDKTIQQELQSESATAVMKDKELRKLYREKYGVKYCIRRGEKNK